MANIDDFRQLHPAFANLDPAQMVKDGLSAPLHPGAERYYEEADGHLRAAMTLLTSIAAKSTNAEVKRLVKRN